MQQVTVDDSNRSAVELLKRLDAEGYKTIVITGGVGIGKTFLVQNLVRHDYSIDEPTFKQHVVSNTAVMIPQGVSVTAATLPLYPLEALAKFPSVFYDDMGSADLTAALSEKTLYWLNERIKSKTKRTVITTNLTLEELEKRESRIFSRLCEGAVIVVME
ncbi:MAG: hypothetical protein WA194_09350 [Patescibacteria group bacterium]